MTQQSCAVFYPTQMGIASSQRLVPIRCCHSFVHTKPVLSQPWCLRGAEPGNLVCPPIRCYSQIMSQCDTPRNVGQAQKHMEWRWRDTEEYVWFHRCWEKQTRDRTAKSPKDFAGTWGIVEAMRLDSSCHVGVSLSKLSELHCQNGYILFSLSNIPPKFTF